jgi:hypothetical protein
MEKDTHLRLVTDAPVEQQGSETPAFAVEASVPLQQTVEIADAADVDPHAELRQQVAEARQGMKDTPFNPVTGDGAEARRAFFTAKEALAAAEYGEPEGAPILPLRRLT